MKIVQSHLPINELINIICRLTQEITDLNVKSAEKDSIKKRCLRNTGIHADPEISSMNREIL